MPSFAQHTNPPTVLGVRCHEFHRTPFSRFVSARIDVDSSSTFLIKGWTALLLWQGARLSFGLSIHLLYIYDMEFI